MEEYIPYSFICEQVRVNGIFRARPDNVVSMHTWGESSGGERTVVEPSLGEYYLIPF